MKNIEIDFSAVTRQFEGLQGRHPGLWPALPRTLLLVGLLAAAMPVMHMRGAHYGEIATSSPERG